MDTKDRKFEEQDHPLKNTDHAFIQVGKNGEPVVPKDDKDTSDELGDKDRVTTLDKR